MADLRKNKYELLLWYNKISLFIFKSRQLTDSRIFSTKTDSYEPKVYPKSYYAIHVIGTYHRNGIFAE